MPPDNPKATRYQLLFYDLNYIHTTLIMFTRP